MSTLIGGGTESSGSFLDNLGNLGSEIWNGVSNMTVAAAWDGVKAIPGAVENAVTTAWNGVKNVASAAWDGVTNTGQRIANFFTPDFNGDRWNWETDTQQETRQVAEFQQWQKRKWLLQEAVADRTWAMEQYRKNITTLNAVSEDLLACLPPCNGSNRSVFLGSMTDGTPILSGRINAEALRNVRTILNNAGRYAVRLADGSMRIYEAPMDSASVSMRNQFRVFRCMQNCGADRQGETLMIQRDGTVLQRIPSGNNSKVKVFGAANIQSTTNMSERSDAGRTAVRQNRNLAKNVAIINYQRSNSTAIHGSTKGARIYNMNVSYVTHIISEARSYSSTLHENLPV